LHNKKAAVYSTAAFKRIGELGVII
jgi:hypothetical protein